ncbi:peptidase [Methyloradius palustris]|uniref:Peptidase n=2 Tax=Methyloradius palustris TaxID=2778876 RepID=A0A8D5GAU4_9PROT|nr:peptidase [Methyloradius palustris]
MGFFSPTRWRNLKGNHAHEISLNPTYFLSKNLIEIFQTLVHEQCHLWQFEHGQPSRFGYHNQEWARKMKSVGLIPSDTGQPNGNVVGQKMADYPEKNGIFMSACLELIDTGYLINWIDRQPAKKLDEGFIARTYIATTSEEFLYTPLSKIFTNFEYQIKPKKSKVKYHCIQCGMNVWGKSGLNIQCIDCKVILLYCISD